MLNIFLKQHAFTIGELGEIEVRPVNGREESVHVPGQSLKRVARDWRERYGYEPVMVVMFVNPEWYRV